MFQQTFLSCILLHIANNQAPRCRVSVAGFHHRSLKFSSSMTRCAPQWLGCMHLCEVSMIRSWLSQCTTSWQASINKTCALSCTTPCPSRWRVTIRWAHHVFCTLLPAHSEIDAAREICRHIDACIECMLLQANPCFWPDRYAGCIPSLCSNQALLHCCARRVVASER